MDKIAIIFAKLAGLQKTLRSLQWSRRGSLLGSSVDPYLKQFFELREKVKKELPELFDDLSEIKYPEPSDKASSGKPIYSKFRINPIMDNIDYILEVRSNSRIGEKKNERSIHKRIFISHGRSQEWFKLQAYLEKDLKLDTLELAQEAHLGRSIMQKLNDESKKCGYAIIVMTGDDIIENGKEIRARENVLHEIGFFQGKYGLGNICLLHEESVNIPSNIHGLGYIPFPKDTIEASFGALFRELKYMMN